MSEQPAVESWARKHARENPRHRAREGLDDPGSCYDCRERSPIYGLAARPTPPADCPNADLHSTFAGMECGRCGTVTPTGEENP